MNFSRSSAEETLYRSSLAFAKEKCAGLREGIFSRAVWDMCAMQGLTALMAGTGHGGAGLGAGETAVVMEALGEGSPDGGFNFSLGAHLFAGLVPLVHAATEEQRQKYIPGIAAGKIILANAMTEAVSGSDAFGMKTTAVKTDGGYRLNGSKVFCTNAPLADLLIVYAATDPQKGFFGGITAFLLEKNRHQYKVGEPHEKMGLLSSPMADVYFDDLFVEDAQVLGKPGAGAAIFNHSMNWERMGLSAMHVGTMQRLCSISAAYANARLIGENKIGTFQAVGFRLADMFTRTEAARMLVFSAAQKIDSGGAPAAAAAKAKIYSSEALIATAQDAMLIHGGNGYMKSTGIEQALRDAMASATYSGTNDVLRSLVAGLL
ncbi:MAG: acyl-CoA dehydrogenase [Bacteroidetes bacterium]|nr:MAG: acyl-CoA dehydrogenase [Bacteroidota bacterium]